MSFKVDHLLQLQLSLATTVPGPISPCPACFQVGLLVDARLCNRLRRHHGPHPRWLDLRHEACMRIRYQQVPRRSSAIHSGKTIRLVQGSDFCCCHLVATQELLPLIKKDQKLGEHVMLSGRVTEGGGSLRAFRILDIFQNGNFYVVTSCTICSNCKVFL